MSWRLGLVILLVGCASVARADEAPPADAKPKAILQLEAGGPTAAVTSLVFSKDGKTLYAGGLDKVVRVWEQEDDKKPVWTLKRSFRVPIGPGVAGAINAMALSPDGRWLAVGGRSVMRGESEFRQPGLVVPIAALSETMWRDSGSIHVFDLRNPAGGKQLRGHQGEVRALAFAPERAGKPPLLVSAAYEFAGGKPVGGAVRLWNVEKGGDALAVLPSEKLPVLQENPGLAVWHTGDGDKDMRVAIAWPDNALTSGKGRLRLWDAADGSVQSWESGSGNTTAALLGFSEDEPRVATGRVRKADNSLIGELRVLQFSRAKDTKAVGAGQIEFVFDRVSYRPVALAPVSAQANGRFDYVATVLQPGKEDLENLLTLSDLGDNPAVRVRMPLKNTDPIHAPVVAAAPRGKWLAVAGFADRAIEIYAIDDLLARKMAPAARLHSKGVLYSKAVFVRRDKEMGLWLSENPKAEPLKEGAFFSFEKRVLANDAKGWTNDTPSRAGWSVEFKSGAAIVSHGDTVYPKMALQPGQQPTYYALRPSTAQRKQAFLAVAHTNRDTAETYITLFDVATGRPLRQFTGHLQDVRWLAFSDTHPLLVSASEDQTVAVWSFADLGAGVGMIDGLVVGERDGKVVVRSAEANSAAAKAGLKSSDVIEGIVVNDKVQPAASAVDFYWTVNLKKPGDSVNVKIAGKAAVGVAVGYGVEERKPLLSLFVTRDRHEWIGWTPGGPFDRSSDNADALIGWHVNTGKPEQPATFVAAGEYQKEFYKQNIMKYLVEEGSLAGALKKWEDLEKAPPPEPELSAGVDGAVRDLKRPDMFPIHQKNVKLTASLVTAAYPLDPSDEVLWQVVAPDGKKSLAQPMKQTGERSWEADLSRLAWKQGEFRVEVLFRSKRYDKKTSQALTLRYQPPAPHLAGIAEKKDLKADAEPVVLTVMEPKIAVQVSVTPQPGQSVEMRFVQPGAKEMPKPRSVAREETFTQEFALQEGVNDLEIVAVNKDALKGFEADETSVLRVQVKYQKPEKQPPPRIAALRIDKENAERFRDHDGKEYLVVTVPRLSMIGAIEADYPLTVAEWSAGDEKAKSLLEPQSPKKLDVRQTVDLEPGKLTTLRLRAQTKTSEPAEATLRVVYYPLLPHFTNPQPLEGPEVYSNQATISGVFQAGSPNEPYQATVRITDASGKEVGNAKLMIDEKKEGWTAVVPLAPGENIVEVIVQSKWRSPVTESVTIAYKRPPTIDPVDEIKVGDTPLVKVTANVWSPDGVKLVGATLNGKEWKDPVLQETDETKEGRKRWTVTLKDVPVKDGAEWRKVVELNVRNDDGLSRAPATIKIIPPAKPVPVAPIVKMQIPDQDTAQQSKYRVPVFVQSDSPLKRAELWRGDDRYPLDLKNVTKNGTKFELRDTVEVALEWEANSLRLVAVNDGGEATAAAVVSLPRPPVRAVVDKIDEVAANGAVNKSQTPREQTVDRVAFDQLAQNVAFLHGHIEWVDDNSPELKEQNLKVVVYVNGARQFPVALEPRGTGKQHNQRAFTVPMLLPKAKGNEIEIEVPSLLKQEAVSLRTFALDCANAVGDRQRLHVLIIGVNVTDGEQLKTNMLATLQEKGTELPRGYVGEFKSPAFKRARLAGVLFGNVRREAVFGQLGEIEKQIHELQEQTGWQNDVVLVYFQGNEDQDARGNRYLRTSLTEALPAKVPLERTALAYNDLPQMPGVQLIMLNVARVGQMGGAVADKDLLPGNKHAVLFHYECRIVAEVRKSAPPTDVTESLKENTLGEIGEAWRKKVKENNQAVAEASFARIPEQLKDRQMNAPR